MYRGFFIASLPRAGSRHQRFRTDPAGVHRTTFCKQLGSMRDLAPWLAVPLLSKALFFFARGSPLGTATETLEKTE